MQERPQWLICHARQGSAQQLPNVLELRHRNHDGELLNFLIAIERPAKAHWDIAQVEIRCRSPILQQECVPQDQIKETAWFRIAKLFLPHGLDIRSRQQHLDEVRIERRRFVRDLELGHGSGYLFVPTGISGFGKIRMPIEAEGPEDCESQLLLLGPPRVRRVAGKS